MLVPIPNTAKMIKSCSSDVLNKFIKEHKASGYVVLLEDITIRPANQNEVTYG